MPSISVVIPVKNGERTIEAAVRSILLQDYTDFDVIIVDDGSTDRTATILEGLRQFDRRISVIKNDKTGVGAARNSGIRASDSDFIATMDADDISLPIRFSQQIQRLRDDPHLIVVGSRIIQFGDQVDQPPIVTGKDVCKRALSLFYPFCHPTTMMRRSAFDQAGGYPEGEAQVVDDYWLATHMAPLGDFDNVPTPLLLYRTHANQISAARRDKQLHETIHLIHDYNARCLGREDIPYPELLTRMAAIGASLPWRYWRLSARSLKLMAKAGHL